MNDRLLQTARVLAHNEHRASGGVGEPPDSLLNAKIAELDAACEAAQNTPQPRQAPAIQPTNGMHPDERRQFDVRRDLQTVRSLDGREHRIFAKGQRLADYTENKRGLTLHDIGNGLCAIISGHPTRYRDEVRAMSTGHNPSGGFLITDEVSNLLIDAARDRSRLFQLGARTIEMGTDTLRLVRLDSDVTTSVVGENETITASDATFSAIELHARKLASLCYISRELAEDASNAAEIVIESMTSAMASELDSLALDGNGGSDGWLGVLNDPQTTTTGSIGSPTYDDILDAINVLDGLNADGPYAMLANPDVYTTLQKLKTATELQYLTPPPAVANMTMLATNKIANTKAVIGQFDQMIFGLRTGVVLDISTQSDDAFKKHQYALKCVLRADSNLMRGWFNVLTGIS